MGILILHIKELGSVMPVVIVKKSNDLIKSLPNAEKIMQVIARMEGKNEGTLGYSYDQCVSYLRGVRSYCKKHRPDVVPYLSAKISGRA